MKKFMENSIKRVMGTKKNADRKKLKGFTLVEIIVVLVILAILAAAMIPALTGYIDKANEKTAISEARNVVTAAQTIVSEKYALGYTKVDNTNTVVEVSKKNTVIVNDKSITVYDLKTSQHSSILELADLGESGTSITSVTITTSGKVYQLVCVTSTGYKVTYENGSFKEIVKVEAEEK